MRVLQIGKFYPVVGGIEKMMVDVVSGISGCEGVCCDMLCASVDRHSSVVLIGKGSKIICTSTWFKAFATMFSPMMAVVLRRIGKEYDIIHIHHPDPMAALALWMSGYRGKVVLHWHSDILKQRLALKLYAPLQRWLIERADTIVGTSPVYLRESPFLQSERLKKVCIPIGVAPLLPDVQKVEKIRQRYAGKKLIFSLGRFVAYKGFEYLIKAAEFLPDEYLILIGGGGPLKHRLGELIEVSHLQSKVKLLGRVDDEDLSGYFGACDLYVMSSIWKTEAFGIVQIEAMSCGKPVVATKIKGSGVSWVNEDGVSGINVEPENAMAIADAIMNILSDQERYKSFSLAAKERYETLFRKERMIEKCIELYKNVVKS
ncbi:glycosyltransferase [uncultured Bacteroides sp.]|uniref:glycosyltransferase n=1 Tax=uncultured Bacteroides sp. TaxID=162156 RepID=UPI0025FB0AF5|nr:glycosyltransferase [uncultured Bacteroides sp.]